MRICNSNQSICVIYVCVAIDHTQQLLDAVNVTSTRLQLLHTDLMSLIVDIKTNLTILQANCTTEGTPFDTLCNNLLPDPNSIQLQANLSQVTF